MSQSKKELLRQHDVAIEELRRLREALEVHAQGIQQQLHGFQVDEKELLQLLESYGPYVEDEEDRGYNHPDPFDFLYPDAEEETAQPRLRGSAVGATGLEAGSQAKSTEKVADQDVTIHPGHGAQDFRDMEMSESENPDNKSADAEPERSIN